ncbi:MAG: CopD family protein [Trueperaceae bacterium]|nr:MAG: CopD family protein [Trueperaceae bacterium]
MQRSRRFIPVTISMLALAKTLLFTGSVLLIGAGVFVRFTGPDLWRTSSPALRRRFLIGIALGAVLLFVASGLDIAYTIRNTLGFLDQSMATLYVSDTRHGRAVSLRVILIGATAGAAFVGSRHPNSTVRHLTNVGFAVFATVLLGTFSWISHAATMNGTVPMIADLVHFSAAVSWAGSVIYLASLPVWTENTAPLQTTLLRLSSLGLITVATLFGTGIYAGFLHIQDPDLLMGSPYGRTLIIKVLLVISIVMIATLNRFWLLPALQRHDALHRLGLFLRLESVLLFGVLVATGILSTTAVPHS